MEIANMVPVRNEPVPLQIVLSNSRTRTEMMRNAICYSISIGNSMNVIRGDRLLVELGASQVRKRLKGYGFGVKKIETAGKDRAVIIHTATGEHLRELRALFAGYLPDAQSESENADHSGGIV
jgi:hypothetical protein